MNSSVESFRRRIGNGTRYFAVTDEESAILKTLGAEMGFSIEAREELPPRNSDGRSEPQRSVKIIFPEKS